MRGAALDEGLYYDGAPRAAAPGDARAYDEVEDLAELLVACKRAHPELEGVSCGAILSTYQARERAARRRFVPASECVPPRGPRTQKTALQNLGIP